MIFATVGTQLPFPRFIDLLDDIAERHGLDVIAQTCDATANPKHVRAHAQIVPAEFDRLVASCDVIVGHAGIGTILSALRGAKPVILFPRHASLGEHRNEHQLATVASLRDRDGIYVADDAADLERLITTHGLTAAGLKDSPGRSRLVERLRNFIIES